MEDREVYYKVQRRSPWWPFWITVDEWFSEAEAQRRANISANNNPEYAWRVIETQ